MGALSVMIYFVSEALRRLSDYLSYHHDNPWEDTPWAIEHSDDSSVARPASTSRPHR